MKVLSESKVFNCSAKTLWDILSDISRCDWVPSVDEITLEGVSRVFEMEGIGKVRENILSLDNENMKLQYSAVETPNPIEHHLATMQVVELDSENCELNWTTEIDPEIFSEAVHHGMLISIKGLEEVISTNLFIDIFLFITPSENKRGSLVSKPGHPFGILLKEASLPLTSFPFFPS